MSIKIISQTHTEILEYKEQKYSQFMHYYRTTNMSCEEIFRIIGFTNSRNATVRYIRNRLRLEGYNSLKRAAYIRRGEWL